MPLPCAAAPRRSARRARPRRRVGSHELGADLDQHAEVHDVAVFAAQPHRWGPSCGRSVHGFSMLFSVSAVLDGRLFLMLGSTWPVGSSWCSALLGQSALLDESAL